MHAFHNCTYLVASFIAGVNLKLVNEDYRNFYSQLNALQGIAPLGQLIQNLTEVESENTTFLAGDYMDERVPSGNSQALAKWLERVKAVGCCFFGEYEKGANIVIDLGSPEFLFKDIAGSVGSFDLIWIAVCCYASAQQLRKSKYQRYGDKFRSLFQSMAKKGFMNHAIMLQVLDGEFHACRGKTAAAKASFEKAIVSNAKAGMCVSFLLYSGRYLAALCSCVTEITFSPFCRRFYFISYVEKVLYTMQLFLLNGMLCFSLKLTQKERGPKILLKLPTV